MKLEPGRAQVWYAWTAQCRQPELLHYYRSLLSADERERCERFAFDYLKTEYLLTRALCRLTLSRYAPVAPQDWRFRRNEYGRPEIDLPGVAPGLRFNLSNARSLVACIVACDVDAGIDVEETDRALEMLPIADHYFAAPELQALRQLPALQQPQRFFQLWTLKEAYIKARGMGLSLPLQQFWYGLESDPITIGFDPALGDDAATWQFDYREPAAGYAIATALRGGGRIAVDWHEVVPGRA